MTGRLFMEIWSTPSTHDFLFSFYNAILRVKINNLNCVILSPFCPKDDIEFLTKTNNPKGISFQKVKVGSEIALPFLFLSFRNHQVSIQLPIVE
jgi:hypothetical protein